MPDNPQYYKAMTGPVRTIAEERALWVDHFVTFEPDWRQFWAEITATVTTTQTTENHARAIIRKAEARLIEMHRCQHVWTRGEYPVHDLDGEEANWEDLTYCEKCHILPHKLPNLRALCAWIEASAARNRAEGPGYMHAAKARQ